MTQLFSRAVEILISLLKTTKKPSLVELPNDLLLNCFERLPKLSYPTLSLVSKEFLSLLASPELYNTDQCCLYVCLRFLCEPNPRWFILVRSEGLLVPILVTRSPPLHSLSLVVAVDSSLYNISVASKKTPSSRVSVLDCRSPTWRDVPSMKVARKDAIVGVLNGKIYVFGGCEFDEKIYWAEVFDTKTQTWEPLPSPPGWIRRALIKKMVKFEGKFYFDVSRGKSQVVYAYDPEKGRWKYCEGEGSHWMIDKTCYVIENVLYRYASFGFDWYDMESRKWRKVKGLETFMSKFRSNSGGPRVRAMFESNHGGKLVIFWDEVRTPSQSPNRNIWCAMIAFIRFGEIWGAVEWFDVVLTVPTTYQFMHCLAVSV